MYSSCKALNKLLCLKYVGYVPTRQGVCVVGNLYPRGGGYIFEIPYGRRRGLYSYKPLEGEGVQCPCVLVIHT